MGLGFQRNTRWDKGGGLVGAYLGFKNTLNSYELEMTVCVQHIKSRKPISQKEYPGCVGVHPTRRCPG